MLSTDEDLRLFNECSPSPLLQAFSYNYHTCHAYLSLILCIFGICMNAFNVIVLSQKNMNSSTNLLLSHLAISDGLLMVIYIFYDIDFRLNPRLEQGMTKYFAYILLIIVVSQNLFHTFSTWIIVVLAGYRLVYVQLGHRAQTVCTSTKVWISIIVVTGVSIVLTIPIIFTHEVTLHSKQMYHSNETLYKIDYVNNRILQTILFYNSALLVKAFPITLMAVLSSLLIFRIRRTGETRRRLGMIVKSSICTLTTHRRLTFEDNEQNTTATDDRFTQQLVRSRRHFSTSIRGSDNVKHSVQSTKMLLAVVVIYIIAFVPQAS